MFKKITGFFTACVSYKDCFYNFFHQNLNGTQGSLGVAYVCSSSLLYNELCMKDVLILGWMCLIVIGSCTSENGSSTKRQQAISDIRTAERDFAALCLKSGVKKAYLAYSADSANILSADSLVSGKAAIGKYYGQPFFTQVTLQWIPDFVDASESGDLGYTYGHYTFVVKRGKAGKSESHGVFHTVWKKINGEWKFVWDS